MADAELARLQAALRQNPGNQEARQALAAYKQSQGMAVKHPELLQGGAAGGQKNVVKPNMKLDTPGQVINTNWNIQPNQYGPFGSQEIDVDPATGKPRVTTGLSAGNDQTLQGIYGVGNEANRRGYELLNQPGYLDSLKAGDPSQQVQTTENFQNALFSQLTKGLGDQRARDEAALETNLTNRGIPVGSKQWNDQRKQLAQQYDDKFQTAKNQAVTGGTELGLQGTQLGLQGGQLQTNAAATLSGIGQGAFFQPNFQGYQNTDMNALFNTLTGKKISDNQLKGTLGAAEIGAGAQIEAARIAAASRNNDPDTQESSFKNLGQQQLQNKPLLRNQQPGGGYSFGKPPGY